MSHEKEGKGKAFLCLRGCAHLFLKALARSKSRDPRGSNEEEEHGTYHFNFFCFVFYLYFFEREVVKGRGGG